MPGWSAAPTVIQRTSCGSVTRASRFLTVHVHAAGERLDVQRLRVLPIDAVAHAAQLGEVAQVRSAACLLITREIMPHRHGLTWAS